MKKQNRLVRKIILSIILILVTPFSCYAFKFDVWTSGISTSQADKISIQNNIGLQNLGNRSYDWRGILLNEKKYTENLFNENAEVHLLFTKNSNFLYEIRISWTKLNQKNSHDLENKIRRYLEKKYGHFSHSTGNSLMVRNNEKCEGKATNYISDQENDKISLSRSDCFNWLTLRYTDKKLSNMQNIESIKIKTKMMKDSSKL